MCCTIKASNALYGGGVMAVFCTNEAHSERRRLAVHSYYTYVKESRSVQRRLAAVLRSWSRSEPRFFDWSRSRFKILLKPEPTFLGRLQLLFWQLKNYNDLKLFIFHCILYIFL